MQLKDVLIKEGFRFNHKWGQNFITDTNLLNAIVADSQITSQDTVVEIGVGGGTLTQCLASVSKKVIGYEIDTRLKSIHNETLAGVDNVEIVFADILKCGIKEVEDRVGNVPYCVVANLPYYITTPIIMMFIEHSKLIKSITIMVQKEVAERICAKEDTAEYGSLSVAVQVLSDVSLTRQVNRKLFYPVPNVDSSVVHIKFNPHKYDIADKKLFDRVLRCAFAMRRKTLVNNIINQFPLSRLQAEDVLRSISLSTTIRGEVLSTSQFVELTKAIQLVL